MPGRFGEPPDVRTRANTRKQPTHRRPPAMGQPDGDGRDRGHGEGRRAAAGAERCGPGWARAIPAMVRSRRAACAGGRDGQYVRPPRGPGPVTPARAVRQPPRQPAYGRQVRRRLGGDGRARSDAHTGRSGGRDGGAGRTGELDRRGGCAVRQGDDGQRGVGRRIHPDRDRGVARLRWGQPRGGAGRHRRAWRQPGPCVSRGQLFRAAHRAGSDPGTRGQDDRRRYRRAGAGVVRRRGNRSGQPRRHHAARSTA